MFISFNYWWIHNHKHYVPVQFQMIIKKIILK